MPWLCVDIEECKRIFTTYYETTQTCKPVTDPKPLRSTIQEMPVPSTSSSTDSISHPSADADTDALLNTGINSNTVETHSVHSLEFPLSATNDRLIFMGIDISERFHNFQLAVKAKIIQGSMLTLEEHVQHIMALSGIFLLKPGRTHADIHQYIDLDICDKLLDHTLTSNLITGR